MLSTSCIIASVTLTAIPSYACTCHNCDHWQRLLLRTHSWILFITSVVLVSINTLAEYHGFQKTHNSKVPYVGNTHMKLFLCMSGEIPLQFSSNSAERITSPTRWMCVGKFTWNVSLLCCVSNLKLPKYGYRLPTPYTCDLASHNNKRRSIEYKTRQ